VPEDKPLDVEIIKKRYDKFPRIYDEYANTFEGKLHHEIEWEILLKSHLPENMDAKILDAGGGTGRITLPLVKMGYPVTLCDVSSGMLGMAKEKLQNEGVQNRVTIEEANIASLPFPDESFDLVICLHGPLSIADSLKAAGELTRVLKRGGKMIVDAHSRYWAVKNELPKNPDAALKLAKSELNHAYDIFGDWCRVFSPKELRELFEMHGIQVISIYGSFIESLPMEVKQAKEWNDEFLSQVVEVLMCLGSEQSVLGLSFVLRLIGVKS
jgi:ubiquinone/menaquinone biosynthesis C-methylase UbiE